MLDTDEVMRVVLSLILFSKALDTKCANTVIYCLPEKKTIFRNQEGQEETTIQNALLCDYVR